MMHQATLIKCSTLFLFTLLAGCIPEKDKTLAGYQQCYVEYIAQGLPDKASKAICAEKHSKIIEYPLPLAQIGGRGSPSVAFGENQFTATIKNKSVSNPYVITKLVVELDFTRIDKQTNIAFDNIWLEPLSEESLSEKIPDEIPLDTSIDFKNENYSWSIAEAYGIVINERTAIRKWFNGD